MYTKFFVRPGEKEWIKTEITMQSEPRSVLHGTVKTEDGRLQTDALVCLFTADTLGDEPNFVSYMFTDDEGQFIFGPLTAGQLYVVKVYKDDIKRRQLDIVIE